MDIVSDFHLCSSFFVLPFPFNFRGYFKFLFLLFPLISAYLLPSLTFQFSLIFLIRLRLQSNFLRIKFPFLRFHFFPLNLLSISPFIFVSFSPSSLSRFLTTNFHTLHFVFSFLPWLVSLFSHFRELKFFPHWFHFVLVLPIFSFIIHLPSLQFLHTKIFLLHVIPFLLIFDYCSPSLHPLHVTISTL